MYINKVPEVFNNFSEYKSSKVKCLRTTAFKQPRFPTHPLKKATSRDHFSRFEARMSETIQHKAELKIPKINTRKT